MENGITKKQSAVLQGVAIWMMVYHHLYSFAAEYHSLLPFMRADTVVRIAWFCKLCVGLFAFVSGYGMYYVMEKQTGKRFFGKLAAEYGSVLKRIAKLYGRLWLVILLYAGIIFGIMKLPFDFSQLWGNLTALNPTYNGAWWYVEQYAKMLLLLPLLDVFLARFERPEERKCKMKFFGALVFLGVAAIVVGRFWWPGLWNLVLAVKNGLRFSFLLIFIVGYMMARFALYQRADQVLRHAGGWMPVCASVVLVGIVIGLRVMLATDAAYAKLDFLFVPMLVYGLLTLLSHIPYLNVFFAWWGYHSTYIWLVHGLLYGWLYYFIKPHVRLDIWIYLSVLLASAAVSLLLRTVESLPKRWRGRIRKTGENK